MSDLANHCGLTKGAFYHHFSSKEEVMTKSLEMTSNWFKANIFSIGYNEDIPNEEKLKSILKIYYQTFTQETGGCFFANTILETMQVENTFKAISKDFFEAWENSLKHIFKTKYLEQLAKDKSIQVIANIEGAIILMLLHDDTAYLRDAIKRSEDLYYTNP